MQRQLDYAKGTPCESYFLVVHSGAQASAGKLGKARDFTRQAVAAAQRANQRELAGTITAFGVLVEAELGNERQAQDQASAALALSQGQETSTLAAVALGLAGSAPKAQP